MVHRNQHVPQVPSLPAKVVALPYADSWGRVVGDPNGNGRSELIRNGIDSLLHLKEVMLIE